MASVFLLSALMVRMLINTLCPEKHANNDHPAYKLPLNYSDAMGRYFYWPLTQVVYLQDPVKQDECLGGCFDSFEAGPIYDVRCGPQFNFDHRCMGGSFISHDFGIIGIGYAGAKGGAQVKYALGVARLPVAHPELPIGQVDPYYWGAFKAVYLEGGLANDFRAYRRRFPHYNILLLGFSMGGAMATMTAAHIALEFPEFQNSDRLRVVSYGMVLFADVEFAANVNKLVPHQFRIVRSQDPAPRGSEYVKFENTNVSAFHHPGIDIAYPNDMLPGDPYEVCPEFYHFNSCTYSDRMQLEDKYRAKWNTTLGLHIYYYTSDFMGRCKLCDKNLIKFLVIDN